MFVPQSELLSNEFTEELTTHIRELPPEAKENVLWTSLHDRLRNRIREIWEETRKPRAESRKPEEGEDLTGSDATA